MPEVVDLISSDTETTTSSNLQGKPAPKPSATKKSTVVTTQRRVPSRLANADFDLTLDDEDDLFWSRRTKRQKHDAVPVVSERANTKAQAETVRTSLPKTTLVSRDSFSVTRSVTRVEDDIIATSSAEQNIQVPEWATINSQDTIEGLPMIPAKPNGLSTTTAALLEEISSKPSGKKRSQSNKTGVEDIQDDELSSSFSDEPAEPELVKPPSNKTSTADKAEQRVVKATEREQQQQERAAEKEAAKQARAEARAAKAAEKRHAADLADVNRSKMDKNVTTPEMIVDFPTSMEGSSTLTQCREFLRQANSETSIYTSEIPGIIKYRRKIRADFNEELGYMLRAEPRIDNEKIILLYLLAEDFACLVSPLDKDDETLETHLDRVRHLHPDCRIIYLIEGLERLIAKEKGASNRAYQAAVRRAAAAAAEKDQQATASTSTESAQRPARRTRNKNSSVIVDEAAIEAALLSLQIEHGVQIHQCMTPLDAGETVLAMTQQQSLSRYRDPPRLTALQMTQQPNFCMSTGQVPTGKDLHDTYLKILQQVIRVTDREARAIANVHPNLGSLFAAFTLNGSKALENIMKEGGGRRGAVEGAPAAERRIGPATSERLFRIFMGRDAADMIG